MHSYWRLLMRSLFLRRKMAARDRLRWVVFRDRYLW